MRKIKIAQIGTTDNSHGNDIWENIKRQNGIFEIVGFAFPENEREKFPERMKSFDGYKEYTVEEIISNSEIEAVIIETEELYLTKYALQAARAGKHIHMEKPGGFSLRDYQELLSIMKKTGKVFHTGYMYRYNPYVKELIENVRKGELGEIISVEAQMNCLHPKKLRQWLCELPGGVMFFLGCHLVDIILQINGQPKGITTFNTSTGVDGVTSKDFAMAVFEYKNGISFLKINSNEKGGFARRQIVVSGTKKTVEIKPLEMYPNGWDGGLFTAGNEYNDDDWLVCGEYSKTELFNRYDAMMYSFAEYVRGEKKNPYTLEYESELYKTILKCCEVNENV